MRNPYERPNILGDFMAGWSAVTQIRDEAEARKDREQGRKDKAEDREWTRTTRGRDTTRWDQEQEKRTLDAPVEAAEREMKTGVAKEWVSLAPLREKQAAGQMALAEDVPNQVKYEQGKRTYDEAGRMTPEQLRSRNMIALEADKLGLDATRANIRQSDEAAASSRETRRGSKLKNDRDQRLWDIDQKLSALKGKNASFMDDPQTQDDVMEVYAGIQESFGSGKGFAGLAPQTQQKALTLMNKAFADDLSNRGDNKTPNGDDIVEREIVTVMGDKRDPDHVSLQLKVTAKGKDGKTYVYAAPVTKDGKPYTGDPDVAPLKIPVAKLNQRVEFYADGALKARQGGFDLAKERQKIIAQLEAERDQLAGGASGTKAGGRRSAQVEYLDYVTKNVFGGDSKKAFAAIKNVGPDAVRAKIVTELGKTPPKDALGNSIPLSGTEISRIADSIVSALEAQSPEAKADNAVDMNQFQEGNEYEDANGNRAIFKGGQFVPVE